MARITLAPDQRPHRPSLMIRGALAVSRRMYGRDLDSVRAMSHHPGVFWPWALMEVAGERRRSRLPRHLDDLVVVATAMHLGCSWCIDFGSSLWERKGLDRDVLADLRRWRDAERFDDDTRAALAFAEAASGDLDQVSDGMVEDLRRRFGEDGVVELAYLVALENMRSRFNSALGLSSQGFSGGDACAIAAGPQSAGSG